MSRINVFEPHIARDFDVFFQKDAALETKVDVRYLKYSIDEIDKYINEEVKPELDEYVEEERSKIESYHLDLNGNILSLEGTNVTSSAVDLGELALADKYVTLVGSQNIDAVKIFTQNPIVSKNETPALEVQNTSTLFGSAPIEDQISSVNFTDSTNTILGAVQHKICTDASVLSSLSCSNLEATENSEIAIGYDEDGVVYTKAPTPDSGDNSTKIATTAFVAQVEQGLQGEIALKQNIVSDLDTIRNGAGLGATAVQPTDLAAVATSGNYADLSNKPTIPTVNNATLTIQKNGTTVNTFSANASSNVTANITVPTKVSDLTNDSGYITGITSAGVIAVLGYTPANDSDVAHKTGNETIAGNKSFSGNLTATTQVNSDNSTKVATTAFVKNQGYMAATEVKSGNGYIKFSNGIIIQWGHLTGNTTNVTLPTAFTTTNYKISVVPTPGNGSSTYRAVVDGDSKTTTAFDIGRSDSFGLDWIAIGW